MTAMPPPVADEMDPVGTPAVFPAIVLFCTFTVLVLPTVAIPPPDVPAVFPEIVVFCTLTVP